MPRDRTCPWPLAKYARVTRFEGSGEQPLDLANDG